MHSVRKGSRKSHDIYCIPLRTLSILNNARISLPWALFTVPTQRERTIEQLMRRQNGNQHTYIIMNFASIMHVVLHNIPLAVSAGSPVARDTDTGIAAWPCLTIRNIPESPSVTVYITGSNSITTTVNDMGRKFSSNIHSNVYVSSYIFSVAFQVRE